MKIALQLEEARLLTGRLVVVVALTFFGSASAQERGSFAASSPPLAQCRGGSGITAEAQISACTTIIDSATAAPDALADAFLARCQARGGEADAIADCDRAVALRPDYVDAYYARAKLHMFRKEFDQAIADYDQTIRLEPKADGAFVLRGMTYADRGDYDKAIADYKRAQELNPGVGLAGGLLEQAETAKVRIAGGQALGDPRAWCDGNALPQEGFANDLQIPGCTKLIESGKENPVDLANDFFRRGTAYDFSGDTDRALADFAQVIALDPARADVHWFRGSVYYLNADYDPAIADFTRAIDLDPTNGLYFSYRGYVYYDKGQFDLAIADYDQAIKLDPSDADAFLHRAIADNGKRDYDRALIDCKAAIRLSRTSEATEGNNACGNAHLAKGDLLTAIADFEAALKLWPEYPEALYGRAVAKIRSGDVVGGQADIAAATKANPDVVAGEAKLGIVP